jgi:hypothetical protein
MGRRRSRRPSAGIAVSSLRGATAAGLGGGGADQPTRCIADHGSLSSFRLLLTLNGLDDPPGRIADHFAAGLGRGKRGEG